MKKRFLLTFIILSVVACIIANTVNDKNKKENVIVKNETQNGNVISTGIMWVNSNNITIPYTLTLPVPSGTVRGVSGPCNENMKNWTVNNGNLSITYTNPVDIGCLEDPDTFYVEYITTEGHKYRHTIISR